MLVAFPHGVISIEICRQSMKGHLWLPAILAPPRVSPYNEVQQLDRYIDAQSVITNLLFSPSPLNSTPPPLSPPARALKSLGLITKRTKANVSTHHKPKMADVEKKSESLGEAVLVEDNLDTLLYDEDGHLRKLPIPSSDPNDPLNFSVWRHRLILAAVTIYGIAGFGLVQSTPLFFGKLIPEYMAQTRGVSSHLLVPTFTISY